MRVVEMESQNAARSSLLRIFFEIWLLSFLGVLFLLFLLAWFQGGHESLRVAKYAAPFWAILLSPIIAIFFTLVYRVYRERK